MNRSAKRQPHRNDLRSGSQAVPARLTGPGLRASETFHSLSTARGCLIRHPRSAICELLVLGIFLVFGQTLWHDFVNYDDAVYVYENGRVTQGLTAGTIHWAFAHTTAGNWHPLTWLTHALDCQLYGLSPWGHHLTNLLLHAATTVLLYLVLRRSTGELWISALVAGIFAIHPLRVESVAWVAERKDVLSGLFFMLTLAAYLHYVRYGFSWGGYLLVVLLFVLGLLSKPMLVTLPLVLLLLDYWPLLRMKPGGGQGSVAGTPAAAAKGQNKSFAGDTITHSPLFLVVEKLPLLALSVLASAITIDVQRQGLATVGELSFLSRLGNAAVSYVVYIGQTFYPVNLAVFYPHPRTNLSAWACWAAFCLLGIITIASAVLVRRCPALLVGWLWYLIMLVPVIGLVQVGIQARADRYTYLPQIGLYIAIVWSAAPLVRRWRWNACFSAATAVAMLFVLMGCAFQQTSHWRDSVALWTHALSCTKENSTAYRSLGDALVRRKRLRQAVEQYRHALAIDPGSSSIHNAYGAVLEESGRTREAMDQYQLAVALNPNCADSHFNLGQALYKQGSLTEASAHFRKSLALNPDRIDARNNLGVILYAQGHVEEAISHYRAALKTDPGNVRTHSNFGNALAKQGRLEEAVSHYRQALRTDPNVAEVHNNLANRLVEQGKVAEALDEYQRALVLKPAFTEARRSLDYFRSRREAALADVRKLRERLREHPNDVAALNNAAWLLATSPLASVRNGTEAVRLARRAVELSGNTWKAATLDTLAAAYAEAGQFSQAAETARQAVALVEHQEKPIFAGAARKHLALYESGKPYRCPLEPRP
jgi:protein O-mannosyl-transferase